MNSLTFGFASALFLLPLAGLPILLHLLFKQKSPIIQFSTLRFLKMSVQRTAARRRLQKWLLLACRALLLALLIWAIAQPAKKFLGNFSAGGRSVAAAIVVDTSYSMQYQEGQVTLLSKADGIVQDLLRGQLASAKVAIFQSLPRTEQLRSASAVVGEWTPLQPEPNPKPLVDRVAAAVALLDRQPAEQKWLIVLSDFQMKEFSRSLGEFKGGRTILFDLHPPDVRSAGVTRIEVTPKQPIPGIASEATVQVTGQSGAVRAVILKTESIDGNVLSQSAPAMATIDGTGRGSIRFPIKLPSQQFVLLDSSLTADDAMAWDHQRSQLIEIPPKQEVTLLSRSSLTAAERFAKLALDPSEGKLAEWPVAVNVSPTLSGHEGVAVVAFSKWPDLQTATNLRNFVRAGRKLVLFLEPGIENSWSALPSATRDVVAELLPSAPTAKGGNQLSRIAVAEVQDELLEGLADKRFQLDTVTVRSVVPMTGGGDTSVILNAVPSDPLPGAQTHGLLFRKNVGQGVCFTLATLPQSQYTNLATHPTFLPMLVRMALRATDELAAQNSELGQPLHLAGNRFPAESELRVEGPQHEQYRVEATESGTDRQFVFNEARRPGLYIWRKKNDPAPVAISNVQLPAAEAELSYRSASSIASSGDDTIIASSVADLETKVSKLSEGEPQWSGPIAIVMFLLCLEALMGNVSKIWTPSKLREQFARSAPAPAAA